MDFLIPRRSVNDENEYINAIALYKTSKIDGDDLRHKLNELDVGVIGNMYWHRSPEEMKIGDVYYYSVKGFESHVTRTKLLEYASVIVLPYTVSEGQLLNHEEISDNFLLYSINDKDFKDDLKRMKIVAKDLIFQHQVLKFPGMEDKIRDAARIDSQFSPRFTPDISLPVNKVEVHEINLQGSTSHIEDDFLNVSDEVIVLPEDPIDESDEIREINMNAALARVYESTSQESKRHKTGQYVIDVMMKEMNPVREEASGHILLWNDRAREDEYVTFDKIGHLDLQSALEIAFRDCPHTVVIKWLLNKTQYKKDKVVRPQSSVLPQPAWMTFSRWFKAECGFTLLKQNGQRLLSYDDIVDYTHIVPNRDLDVSTFLLYFFAGANISEIIYCFLP